MVGSCLPPPDDLWGAEAACVCGFCLWQHFTTSQTFCLKSPSGISYCGSSCWGVCGAPLHPWAYCPCSQPRWEAWQQWQRHCECWGKNWDGTSIWQLLNSKAERSADLALGHWGLSWCDIWVRWYFPTTRRCLSISYALKLWKLTSLRSEELGACSWAGADVSGSLCGLVWQSVSSCLLSRSYRPSASFSQW